MIDITPMNIRIWSRLGSCGAFGQAALALPKVEERTVILLLLRAGTFPGSAPRQAL